MNVAAELKTWRRREGLKATIVGKWAGVTRATVYNWERGLGEPTTEQLVVLDRHRPGLLGALGLKEDRRA